MNLRDFLSSQDFNSSFLLGFYGGTNFGDELLLEVLQNKLHSFGVRDMTIYYIRPARFTTYHHDFGYKKVSSPWGVLKSILLSKNIIVGGGGLWGRDFNMKMLVMSALLFCSKVFLRKRLYLLGVGYYASTSTYGHVGAWFVAKSADYIYVRDPESFQLFKRFRANVLLDRDIAFMLPEINVLPYSPVHLSDASKFILIGLRGGCSLRYLELVRALVRTNPNVEFVLSLFEGKDIFPRNYEFVSELVHQNANAAFFDCEVNPVDFYLALKGSAGSVLVLAPQFHVQLVAYLVGAEWIPIFYDNKNERLFDELNIITRHSIDSIEIGTLQTYLISFNESQK